VDALLDIFLSYLSGFKGLSGATFVVSTGLAGALTWFTNKRAIQEFTEREEKKLKEAGSRTNSLLPKIIEAGRHLAGEPNSREEAIRSQMKEVDLEMRSMIRNIDAFSSEVSGVVAGAETSLLEAKVSVENAGFLCDLVDVNRRGIEDILGLLREAGRLDESYNLVDVDGLDPGLVEELERGLAMFKKLESSQFLTDRSRIIKRVEERIGKTREKVEGITDGEFPVSGQTGEVFPRRPQVGDMDIPGPLRLPSGAQNTSQQLRRPAQGKRSRQQEQPKRERRGRT